VLYSVNNLNVNSKRHSKLKKIYEIRLEELYIYF